jgi:serine/threonine-protein kinase
MEFLEGESLDRRLLRDGRLALAQAYKILSQVARGLEAAHASGIVHRDLKPPNIVVSPEGRAVVTDFGIARFATAKTTAVGKLKLTPSYVAPEQLQGKKATPLSDVYSLAVTCFEMLTGKVPFTGKTAMDEAFARLERPAPLAHTFDASIPKDLSAAIASGLERDPARRPQTPGQFVASLLEHTP